MIYVKLDRHKALNGSSNFRPRWWEGIIDYQRRHKESRAIPHIWPVYYLAALEL